MKLILVLAFAVTLSGCAQIEELLADVDKPTAKIAGVSFSKLELDAVTLAFDVEITNPYSVALPLVGLDFNLDSAGNQFLSGSSSERGSIPAQGKRTIPVETRIPFFETLQVLKGVKPGALVPYTAKLDVSVDAPAVGPMKLPLSRDGEFPVPTVPKVSVNDIRWQKIGLGEATAVVDLGITNDNQFGVDLTKLAYGLKLGGTPIVTSSVGDGPTSFAAGASRSMPVSISFKPSSLGLGVLNMIRGNGAGYEIAGTADLATKFGNISMPYSSSGNTTFSK